MLGYQPWRCMKHNLIVDVVIKPRWFLKIVWENFVVKQFASFLRTNCERAKDQHFHMQIVCMSYFYNSVYYRLLCDNSNSRTYEPRKGAKFNTFTCQLCDCTSHADWLFTMINSNLDVWRPVSFCNQCLKKGSCLLRSSSF